MSPVSTETGINSEFNPPQKTGNCRRFDERKGVYFQYFCTVILGIAPGTDTLLVMDDRKNNVEARV